MGSWHAYKYILVALCVSVLVGSIIAIHAIHAGRTNAHLQRVTAILWYIALGAFAIDFVVSGMLFGFENSSTIFENNGTMTQLVVGIIITILWTTYLMMSERCKRRYPVQPSEQTVAAPTIP